MRLHSGILDAQLLLENQRFTFRPAPLHKRMINITIDLLAILHLSIFTGTLLGIFLVAIGKEGWASGDGNIFQYEWVNLAITGVIIFSYYFVCELFLFGKTLGKYATRTSVKTTTGHPASKNNILVRCILRLIPLDGLTFLMGKNYGWHDTLSRTMVFED